MQQSFSRPLAAFGAAFAMLTTSVSTTTITAASVAPVAIAVAAATIPAPALAGGPGGFVDPYWDDDFFETDGFEVIDE